MAWITDRVASAGDAGALTALAARIGDRLSAYGGDRPVAFGLATPSNTPDALTLRVLRAGEGASEAGTLRALDSRGRPSPRRGSCFR